MIKFGLTNLRRLRRVEPISLKPITLLVGRNSGGKSTFLRTFPLIRQSLMTRTSSPILWYGDFVDFGAFDTSLSRQAEGGEMSFTFSLDDLLVTSEHPVFYGDEIYYARTAREVSLENVTFSVSLTKHNEKVRISSANYNIPEIESTIRAEINEAGIIKLSLNGRPLGYPTDGIRLANMNSSLLPDFRFLRERPASGTRPAALYALTSPLLPTLNRILRSKISGRVGDKSITQLATRLVALGPPTDERLLSISNAEGALIGRGMSQLIAQGGAAYSELKDTLYAIWFPDLAKSVSQAIKSIFGSTLYIGPVRARSERYYRYQELAISEIDPDGKNFPMFLNSLSKRQFDEFSNWTKKMFGYGISLSRPSGHISINLVDGGKETNIVDVGYGVSQILPVLGQIWWAKARPQSKADRNQLSLLAIEQPELHLHPAHQALLADALIGEATDSPSSSRMHYVVETHSETLINRIGEFIAAKRLSPQSVQVVLFDAGEDGETHVRTVNYDDDGVLIDWPFGFFQPSMLT